MAISGSYTTNDAISFNNCAVAVDQTPASSAFAEISSWATSVSVSGGDVPTSQQYPFSGDVIVLVGNQQPFRITVEVVYTEGTNDPFTEIWDDFQANPGLDYDVRWVPQGSASGYHQFTSGGGKLINVTAPQGTGEGAGATMFSFEIEASSITRATTA